MFPRWMSWLFLIFFGYLLFAGNQAAHRQREEAVKPGEVSTAPATESYPAVSALLDGERWKRGIYPDYKAPETPCSPPPKEEGKLASYAIIENAGEGEGAQCGDSITLSVTPWNDDGSAADAHEITLTLSEQKGLDALLLGITPAETRTLFFRPQKYDALPFLKEGKLQVLTVERSPNSSDVIP